MKTEAQNKEAIEHASYGCDDLSFDLSRRDKWRLFCFQINTRLQQPLERAFLSGTALVSAVIALAFLLKFMTK